MMNMYSILHWLFPAWFSETEHENTMSMTGYNSRVFSQAVSLVCDDETIIDEMFYQMNICENEADTARREWLIDKLFTFIYINKSVFRYNPDVEYCVKCFLLDLYNGSGHVNREKLYIHWKRIFK